MNAFSRMSARERTLVFTLIGLMLLGVLGGGVLYVRSQLSDKETQIQKNRTSWKKIRKLSGPYLARLATRQMMLERIKDNPDALSPDNPVAVEAVQSKVKYRTGTSGDDEEAPLNKILHVTGELGQKPLLKKRRTQRGPQIYRVEKRFQMKRGFARTDDLWGFLGSLESMNNMVFVSRLHIVRWSRDPDYAQIKNLTASTLRYVESEEEQ
jgi:hypothetical protein